MLPLGLQTCGAGARWVAKAANSITCQQVIGMLQWEQRGAAGA